MASAKRWVPVMVLLAGVSIASAASITTVGGPSGVVPVSIPKLSPSETTVFAETFDANVKAWGSWVGDGTINLDQHWLGVSSSNTAGAVQPYCFFGQTLDLGQSINLYVRVHDPNPARPDWNVQGTLLFNCWTSALGTHVLGLQIQPGNDNTSNPGKVTARVNSDYCQTSGANDEGVFSANTPKDFRLGFTRTGGENVTVTVHMYQGGVWVSLGSFTNLTFPLMQADRFEMVLSGVNPEYPDGVMYFDQILVTRPPIAATPTFSPDGGLHGGNQVTIQCATAGATIYYTTDNSTPTTSSPSVTSGQTIAITPPMTLKAYAVASGFADSSVKSADFVLPYFEGFESYPLGTDMFTQPNWSDYNPGQPGTYRVGDMLVDQGQSYVFTDSGSGVFLAAHHNSQCKIVDNSTAVYQFAYNGTGHLYAVASNLSNGRYVQFNHWDGMVAAESTGTKPPLYLPYDPQRNHNTGKVRMVFTPNRVQMFWKANWSDAWIEFDRDGSGQYLQSGWDHQFTNIYDAPYFYFFGSSAKPTAGVDSCSLWVQAGPVVDFYPDGGSYLGTRTVRVNTVPAGGTLYYTTDNSTPTTSSPSIADNGTITVNQSMTLKVLPVLPGWTSTAISQASYTIIGQAVPPTFSPDAGAYSKSQTVTISSATSGATIYYTLDNSTPTTSSASIASGATVSVDHTLTLKAIAVKAGLANSEVKSATYTLPDGWPNRLATIPYINHINVDGNLTTLGVVTKAAWANAEWAPLDKAYWWPGYPSTGSGYSAEAVLGAIPEAYVAYKWGDNGTKLYVAVRVRDIDGHTLNGAWSGDMIEVYIHTNGLDGGYHPTDVNAQQFGIGIGSPMWVKESPLNLGAAESQLTAAGKEDGEWYNYEVALTPFQTFNTVTQTLHAGDIIGLDVVANTGDEYGTTGMVAECVFDNGTRLWKSQFVSGFAIHALAGVPGDANGDFVVNGADLSIVLAAMDSKPPSDSRADLDGDGEVTSSDLSIVLANMP